MKYALGICMAMLTNLSWAVSLQRIHIEKKQPTLQECLNEIKKQTGYSFVHLEHTFNKATIVEEDLRNSSLDEALEKLFADKHVTYTVKNKTIVLSKKEVEDSKQQRTIEIKVLSTTGDPISGASIIVTATGRAIGQSDVTGVFHGVIPGETKTLLIKHLEYQDYTLQLGTSNKIRVNLKSKENEIEETVITGIYSRDKESFTGSSATFTAKDLKMIGNQNILQSLRTLDPSFAIQDNNLMGSDPNTLPDVNVRGKTSVIGLGQEFENDPNQPLFILDGYETTLKVINDLNIDRVESITILKDASATAIYGSKSANGVIVVETKRPEAGKFKVSYNFNSSFNFADLSDYNLMNSEEKLKFERLSGYYGEVDANGRFLKESTETQKYNSRLAEAKRGVDTYWMNEPLRFAMTQSHNVYADGGDEKMRYGLGLTYGNTPGVMIGSDRNTINGNLRLIYRSGNFSFSNNLTVDHTDGVREPVNFSAYSSANPYFRKYDEFGAVLRVLESFTGSIVGEDLGKAINVYNPMYDASLNYVDRSPSFGFGNNFDIDWRVMSSFRLRGRFGINKNTSKTERFVSPLHSQFEGANSLEKGSFNSSTNESFRYNGDVTATFGKMIAQKHMINVVGGMRLDHSNQTNNGFSVRGFMEESYPNPAFSNGYAAGSKPIYNENSRRSASYFANTGYSFNNRYLFDANFRYDGSSLFGVENQFTSTWSAGVAWNIHNESFMKNVPYITNLKIRGSLGNPGNQNFDARMTMNIYTYGVDNQTPFGLSALITTWGNQNLDWQKTLDRNIGIDFEILNRKLRLNVDYFNKLTDPLLVFVDVPTSTGTSTVPHNIGSQTTKGLTLTANWQVLKTEKSMWSINANARKLNMVYNNFGNALDRYNKDNRSKSLQRYYDGGSPSDIWAVRSGGIDPATGREIFIKKDGTQTFVHDFADEVIVGNTSPKWEGVIGMSYYYKGFNFSMNFRYKLGSQIFQNALYNKVENIDMYAIKSNQDKRALYDRWQKPGDVAKFKGLSLTERTQMSDRFVVDENVFSAESISAGYDFRNPKLLKYGISGLTLRGYMNQIFRVSTVKEERGINYPFARSFSFSVGARF